MHLICAKYTIGHLYALRIIFVLLAVLQPCVFSISDTVRSAIQYILKTILYITTGNHAL